MARGLVMGGLWSGCLGGNVMAKVQNACTSHLSGLGSSPQRRQKGIGDDAP